MSLKYKVVLIMALMITVTVGLNYAVLQRIVTPSFETLEHREAVKNSRRVTQTIQNNLSALSDTVYDWSSWDDTYAFTAGEMDDYVDTNLTFDSLAALKLNTMLFFDAQGKLVWGMATDLDAGEEVDLKTLFEPAQLAPTSPLISHDGLESVIAGVVATKGGPMLVASRPILTTDDEGPARGALVMGRLLNGAYLATVRDQVSVEFELMPIAEGLSALQLPDLENRIRDSENGVVIQVTEEAQVGLATLPDLSGRPLLLVRSRTPRDITKTGSETVYLALLSFLVIGAADILLMWLLLRHFVLRPVGQLTEEVLTIGQTGNLSSSLKIERRDELGALAREFNRMMTNLNEARQTLVDVSYHAGMAQMASDTLHNVRNALTPLLNQVAHATQGMKDLQNRKIDRAIAELGDAATDAERRAKLGDYAASTMRQIAQRHDRVIEDLEATSRQVSEIEEMLLQQDRVSRAAPIFEALNLSHVIEDALKAVPDDLRNGIEVSISPEVAQVKPLRAPKFGLVQVLQNLLINAAEAVRQHETDNPEIRIGVTAERLQDDEMIHVRIADTGIGIAHEHLGEIFRRGHSTKPEGPRGGFGLHWCANTIAGMNGRLYAESPGPGEGAVMHVILPAAA